MQSEPSNARNANIEKEERSTGIYAAPIMGHVTYTNGEVCELEATALMSGFKGLIEAIAVSTTTTHIAGACTDGTIHIWDYITRKLVRSLTAQRSICQLAYSPNGKYLTFASERQNAGIILLEYPPLKYITLYNGKRDVSAIAWSSDGRFFATACSQLGNILVWSGEDQK